MKWGIAWFLMYYYERYYMFMCKFDTVHLNIYMGKINETVLILNF